MGEGQARIHPVHRVVGAVPVLSVSPPFAARNWRCGSVVNPEGGAPDKTRKAGVGVVAKKGPASEVSPGRGCPTLRLLVEI